MTTTPLYFDRVLGEVPQHIRNFEYWLIIEQYLKRGGEWIEDFEVEKTPQEVELIRFAQDQAITYLKAYGRRRLIELPLNHIHILREGGVQEYTEGRIAQGSYASVLGSIIVDRDPSPLRFALKVFHEHIHWGAYHIIQRSTKDQVKPYRAGLAITTRDATRSFFDDLDEAVTGIFDRRFFRQVLLHDNRFKEEATTFHIEGFSRPIETCLLNELINVLWYTNQHSFSSREEIVEMFITAALHGPLLPVARLIERTCGKGSFRKIAEKTGSEAESEEQNQK